MSLEEFFNTKPQHVRLGQWFICCYCNPNENWEDSLDALWNLPDWRAENFINGLLMHWKWDTNNMPEFKNNFNNLCIE